MTLYRPSAPSPSGERLTLVPFEEGWPSPDLSHIPGPPASEFTNVRVHVLAVLGELLDLHLLSQEDTADLIEIAMRGDAEVSAIADLLEARPAMAGKAQFLKLFLAPKRVLTGYATPIPTYQEWQVSGIYHPPAQTPLVSTTSFVDFPSPILRSASPPLRQPAVVRPVPVKLCCINEDHLVRAESGDSNGEPKFSPESFKSTNAGGSSIDASTVSPPNGPPTRENTQESRSPDQQGLPHCPVRTPCS